MAKLKLVPKFKPRRKKIDLGFSIEMEHDIATEIDNLRFHIDNPQEGGRDVRVDQLEAMLQSVEILDALIAREADRIDKSRKVRS